MLDAELTFDASISANGHKRTVLATEAVSDCRISSRYAISGGPLGRSDMKALTTASQRLVAEVPVERNNDEHIRQGVLHERLVIFGFDSSIPRSYDPMAPPIQEQHHRLDHVLVGQKG